jgi:CHRD domain
MNRRALIAVAMCVFVMGCGDDDEPTSPSGTPMVFTALLSPANEVPPIGNAESGGSGAVQISITGNTADVYFQLFGFPGDTRVIGAHIHPGPAGVNGPVIVPTPITALEAVPLANGGVEYRTSGLPVPAATLQGLTTNPAGFYFNVHSPLNPGGFARGQLTRIQ